MIKVEIDTSTGTIGNIFILGGCHGNLFAMMKLLKGRTISEVVPMLKGITCGRRGTSCPDQIAKALVLYLDGKVKDKGRYEE